MTLERILLIRHGETDWNAARRWQGFALTDLNDRGRRQAAALARYLAQRPIGSLFSSDLPRTLQTAAPLASALKLAPQTDARWREINVGQMEGLSNTEIEQRYPDHAAARQVNYWDYVYPQGESRRQLQNRAYAAWLAMIEQAVGPEVVVISHGGTLKSLLIRLFGQDNALLNVSLPNTCITTLAWVDSGWVLDSVAETPHLTDIL